VVLAVAARVVVAGEEHQALAAFGELCWVGEGGEEESGLLQRCSI
jgi:hypothetical protein